MKTTLEWTRKNRYEQNSLLLLGNGNDITRRGMVLVELRHQDESEDGAIIDVALVGEMGVAEGYTFQLSGSPTHIPGGKTNLPILSRLPHVTNCSSLRTSSRSTVCSAINTGDTLRCR